MHAIPFQQKGPPGALTAHVAPAAAQGSVSPNISKPIGLDPCVSKRKNTAFYPNLSIKESDHKASWDPHRACTEGAEGAC